MLIYILLIGGIAGTILLEMKGKKKIRKVNYKAIFPSTKDEWTEKAFEATVLSGNRRILIRTKKS